MKIFKLKHPVSILMPVSNEQDIIERVVEEWIDDVFRYLPKKSEMIFDEAGSTDKTKEILKKISKKNKFIKTFFNEKKEGFAQAAKNLYDKANCPFVFFTDSDGQYVASEFWKLAPFIEEFSVVHGAKIGRQDTFIRKSASAMFNKISRQIFDIFYSDINSAFRLIHKKALKHLLPKMGTMKTLFNAELLLRAEMENYSIKQVHVIHRARLHGNSRGLPPARFLKESIFAFQNLLKLKEEYKSEK